MFFFHYLYKIVTLIILFLNTNITFGVTYYYQILKPFYK